MTQIEPRQGTPEELPTILDEEFESETPQVIVFAGPELPSQRYLDRWRGGVTVDGPAFAQPSEGAGDHADRIPVIGEFYSAFEQHADDGRFRDLVQNERSCLVVRPRRFDYLYARTELSDWIDVDAATFVYVRYRSEPTARDDEVTAEQVAAGSSDHDQTTITENIETLRYDYAEFEADALTPLPPYLTYIPALLEDPEFSAVDADEYLLPAAITDFLAESGKSEIVSQFVSDLKTAGRTLFGGDSREAGHALLREGASASGLAATAMGQPIIGAGAVIGYLGWNAYRRRGSDPQVEAVKQSLGPLAADYMPPHTRETLEAELDLKPGTISAIQSLTTQPQRLQRLLSFDPDQVTELESRIDGLDEHLTEVDAALAELEAIATTFGGDALLELSALVERELLRQREELEALGIDADRVPDPADREPLRADLAELAAETLAEQSAAAPAILVVTGARGVGKSSFLHELGSELRDTHGYTTRVCNSVVVSSAPERVVHRATDLSSESPVALCYTFDGAPDRSELRQLVGNDLVGTCDVLLIECVDVLYEELDAALSTSDHGEEGRLVSLIDRSRVQLPPLDAIDDARSIGHERSENPAVELQQLTDARRRRIPRALGVEDPDRIDAIVEAGDGNPLCTVEATLLSLAGESVGALRGRAVIRERLDAVVHRLQTQANNPELIERLLFAATVHGETRNLRRLLAVAGCDTEAERQSAEQLVRTTLRGYIRRVGGVWKLTPDVYCELLFDELWFAKENVELETARPIRCRYLDRVAESAPAGLLTCATRLGERWPAAADESMPDVYRGLPAVQAAVEELLEYADELVIDRYCLQALIRSGVPLRERELTAERLILLERFWGTIQIITASGDVVSTGTPPIFALLRRVAKLLANHLYAERRFTAGEVSGVSSAWAGRFTVAVIEAYLDEYDVDGFQTRAVGPLPGDDNPAASQPSVEQVVTHVCAWAFADVYKRTNYSTDPQWIDQLDAILTDLYADLDDGEAFMEYLNYTGKAASFIADDAPESAIATAVDAIVAVAERRVDASPIPPHDYWVRVYGLVCIYLEDSTSDHLQDWYRAVKHHIEANRDDAGYIETLVEARLEMSDIDTTEFEAVWSDADDEGTD